MFSSAVYRTLFRALLGCVRIHPEGITSSSPGLRDSATLGLFALSLSTLKGLHRSSPALVPDVPFVVGDLVALQKSPELVLKRQAAMMFSLLKDVFSHGFDLGEPDGKRTLPTLPGEIVQAGITLLDPERRSALTSATEEVRDRLRSKCTWSSTPPITTGPQSTGVIPELMQPFQG